MNRDCFITAEARPDLKFIQRQTRYSVDIYLTKRIVEKLVKQGIAHVFLKVWRSVSDIDYLSSECFPAFRNLQTILSIIWNCTDKSVALCEALIRCGVIQQFFSELSTERLKSSELTDENELYLVKAFLGILHNMVRLCSDSRRIFRMAHAVSILQLYLHSSQGLVKTKAYIILSYIISDDENGVINSTDENIKYIIDILREALNSENHFSKTYAFWAKEVACGLNHLAVNDLNKVRIVRQGALPLYVKLLESTNMEEQNLGAAGIWILSFRDENKLSIQQEDGCVKGGFSWWFSFFFNLTYCQISNIRCTKLQKLNVSRLILQLSLCYILRPGDKVKMKM